MLQINFKPLCHARPYMWGSQRVVPRPAGSASPKTCTEMQVPRPHPGPTALGTLGVGPSNLGFNKLSGRLGWMLEFENHRFMWSTPAYLSHLIWFTFLLSNDTLVKRTSFQLLDHAKVFSTSGPYIACSCSLEHISHLSSHTSFSSSYSDRSS